MNSIIEHLVLGMYLPIVVMSGLACVLFVKKLLIPAFHNRALTTDRYAIALSASFALGAHAFENAFYGLIRWFPDAFGWLNDQLWIVGAWKLMILTSCVFAVAALQVAESNHSSIGKLVALSSIATVIGAVLSTIV